MKNRAHKTGQESSVPSFIEWTQLRPSQTLIMDQMKLQRGSNKHMCKIIYLTLYIDNERHFIEGLPEKEVHAASYLDDISDWCKDQNITIYGLDRLSKEQRSQVG